MLAEVADFRWPVFDGGYVCADHVVNGKQARCVDPDFSGGDFFSVTERYPLEEDPALFRRFADIETTEIGVLAFANQWGPLRSTLDFWEEHLDEDELPTDFGWTFEPVQLWFNEIKKMNALV